MLKNNANGKTSGLNKILLILLTVSCSLLTVEAQWVQMSNGMGNDPIVEALANSGNNIFAGTTNGVYLSTNNGTNWTQTLNNQWLGALAANGNNVFAGTQNPGSGVYLSTNNGTNWTQTSLNNRGIYSLAVNGNNVFAGTFDYGVYRSTDNGATWTQTSLNNQLRTYSLAFSGNNIFAGTQFNGLHLSTNNGTSWTQTLNQVVYSLSVNGNNIFAGTDTPPNGVYLTTNNGTSWTQTSLNNRSVYSLSVNGNNVFAGTLGNGFYVSNNNGGNWTQRNEGLGIALDISSLCILNNYIFAGTDYSVYRRPLGELTGIKPISEQIPHGFSLSQNYPNPFNPMTNIKFQMPNEAFIKLIVFDVLGREVTVLVNEQLKPGTYEVDWNASIYPSGVYYYKIVAGDYTDTKKIILIK